jgi:hypothetical protein
MNSHARAILSNGWVQNAGIALSAVVINDILFMIVGENRTQTGIYAFAAILTLFIWIVAIQSANIFVPVIKLSAPNKSIDGSSTVPGALPIFRRPISNTQYEVIIRLENVGKSTLSSARVKIELPFGVNLTCSNRPFHTNPGNPRDGGWRNSVEVDLGNMHTDSLPVDLILLVEFQQRDDDLELKCTMLGDQFPGKGIPTVGERLCIQLPHLKAIH